MFKEDTLFVLIRNWWKYKPEDELYNRLMENPYWPFKNISDGYFYVIVQSDRAAYGFWGILFTIIGYILGTYFQGFWAIPQTLFFISFLGFIWAIRGRIAWRELIISRRGRGSYMLRVLQNHEQLIVHDLRNIYIRLAKKDDASGDPYFWLNLSGYELDDYRITRMTKAEGPLRIMGMQLAYRLGINFFDWKDESEEHFIFHYKTYTRLAFHIAQKKEVEGDADEEAMPEEQGVAESAGAPKGAFLAVPKRKRAGDKDSDPALRKLKKEKK